MAAPGDALSVLGDDVNVRDGPSLAHNVILKLHKGNRAQEIQRKNEWVEIAEFTTGNKLGWVHVSLIETVPVSPSAPAIPVNSITDSSITEKRFQVFLASFEKLGVNLKKETGLVFFTRVEELGKGNIQITATDAWIDSATDHKARLLNIIFRLWDEADGIGSPIAVFIVDEHGTQHMSMYR